MERLAEVFGVEGRIAVVTGGAAGLGKTVARLLAEAGASVVIADRDADAAQAAKDEMTLAGLCVAAITTDVTCEDAVCELFAQTRRRFGCIDILVNNAGAYPKRPLTETTAAQWDQVHQLNLRAPFLCMREAIKQMLEAEKGGRIVNVSSVASFHPATHDNGAYAASKAGLNQLTRCAALDYAANGITVNAICPGAMRTEGADRMSEQKMTGPALDPARWILGRFGEPIEIAAAILYLVGPSGGYVTGQTLIIDGGFMVS